MKYLDKTFSAPAGPSGISQRQWDYATLTREEFAAKYNLGLCREVPVEELRRDYPIAQPNPDAHLGAVEP